MKLVNYERFKRQSAPRAVGFAVLEAGLFGIMVGVVLSQILRGFDVWTWMPLFSLAFMFGVQTLQALLVALHKCQPSIESQPSKQRVT